MHTPTAYELVQVWEWGQKKHPIDQALGLVSVADPTLDAETLTGLTVGQRNRRLLTLREQTLGPDLNAFVECTECGEQLEFTVTVGNLLLPEPHEREFVLSLDDVELRCRLPNSADLASIIGLDDVEAGRRLLAQHCLLAVAQNGETLDYHAVRDGWIEAIGDAVMRLDPQTEMYFNVKCPECERNWSVLFDIVAFFWAELENRVKRLLYDVHTLARTYGWREIDILNMSATRRQLYLDIVGG